MLGWAGRLALLGLGSLITALALARLARRGRERPVHVELPQPGLILAALAFLLLPRLLAPLLPSDPNPAHPWNLLPAALALAAALLALFLFGPRPRWFLPRSERPSLRYALAAYVSALPALLGLLAVWAAMNPASDGLRHEIVAGFDELAPQPALLTLAFALLLMPALEEMLFRGWLFAGLAADPRTGRLLALALSAVAFGFSHPPPMILPATALGLLFGWTYWRVGDLRAPILLHVLHNGLVFGLSRVL